MLKQSFKFIARKQKIKKNIVSAYKIKILGTSAGGGLPQWNCNCDNCNNARNDIIPSRMQSSIAISNGVEWTLINASPDINRQINENLISHSDNIRDNRIANIILVDGQLDHTMGLLNIREGNPLKIFCTQTVHKQISEEFPIIKILDNFCGTNVTEIQTKVPFIPIAGIMIIPIDIESNAPKYSKLRDNKRDGSNIGLVILTETKSLFYAPGLLKVTEDILTIFQNVDHILIDGTCWTNNELVTANISSSTASDMGHINQLELLEHLKNVSATKTLIHINNTNPILNPESDQYKILMDAGIKVSYDGMEIKLI
jgi:pyrroloquinoline quinone biosynthesis protein B